MKYNLALLADDIANLRKVDLAYYKDLLGDSLPELQAMADCPQDSIWHAEGDVLTHTQMVMDAAKAEIDSSPDLPKQFSRAIYLAAFLHDIGKPASTYTTEYGRVVSPGHSITGLYLARTILHKLAVPPQLREETIMLIAHHMTAYRLVGRIEQGLIINGIDIEKKKYWRLASELILQSLYYLTRADWIGRTGTGIDRVLNQMEQFKERAIHFNIWDKSFNGVLSEDDLENLIPDKREQARIRYKLFYLALNGRIQSRDEAFKYLKEYPEILEPVSAHLYLTVGVPGVGKSTWLGENLPAVRIVSSDIKRVELFNNVNWQGDNARVFQECFIDVENSLKRGEAVVLDATNVKLNQRATFLKLAYENNVHATIIFFDFPIELAIERNNQRERKVPEAAIANYYRELVMPRRFEAEEIITVSLDPDPVWLS